MRTAEMERQKILWIIFSVALFILVVVGVGVIWFMPTNHSKIAQTPTAQGNTKTRISFDPYEWAKTRNNNYPGLEPTPSGQAASKSSGQGQNGGNFTIIYGQEPTPGTSSSQTATSTPPSSSPPAHVTPAPPPARPAPPPRRVSQPAPAPAPRPQIARPPAHKAVSVVVQHWIQVAAYTSDFRAERAKKALEDKGITGKIMSHEVHGRTFFRVRVGPYLSQREAERFLAQIKKISEFRDSYISLVYASAN